MDLTTPPPAPAAPARDPVLWQKAKQLEAGFLAEMLKGMQPSSGDAGFAGGIGEEQFGSFLREGQARLMVERGGIGLAEQIFRSLAKEGR